MKTLLLGIALMGLSLACKSNNDKMAVEDASNANAPAACSMPCCEGKPGECSDKMSAECGEKAECETKVCPVTGKKLD